MKDGTLVAHHVEFVRQLRRLRGLQAGRHDRRAGPVRRAVPHPQHAASSPLTSTRTPCPAATCAAPANRRPSSPSSRTSTKSPGSSAWTRSTSAEEPRRRRRRERDRRRLRTAAARQRDACRPPPRPRATARRRRRTSAAASRSASGPPGGGVGNAGDHAAPGRHASSLGTPVFDQGIGHLHDAAQIVAEELQAAARAHRARGLGHRPRCRSTPASPAAGRRASTPAPPTRRRVDAEAELLKPPPSRSSSGRRTHLELQRRRDPPQRPRGARALAGPARADRRERQRPTAAVRDQFERHITGFAAQVAEVEVDPETGEVKLLRFTSAHDVGRVLNPMATRARSTAASCRASATR